MEGARFRRQLGTRTSPDSLDRRQRPRLPRGLGLDRFSGVYLWILFIVVFGIWTPSEFLTISTVHGVASTQAVTGIVALAVLIPLAAGLYDLSVGATANLTGMLAAKGVTTPFDVSAGSAPIIYVHGQPGRTARSRV